MNIARLILMLLISSFCLFTQYRAVWALPLPACPISSEPIETLTICEGEVPSLPNGVIQAAISDPDAEAVGAPNPQISWYTDVSLSTPYFGDALQHSNVDHCSTEQVSLFAAITCATDNSLISAGVVNVTIYPQPTPPVISKDDQECNYTLLLSCPTLDNLVSSNFPLLQNPGDPPGAATLELDNGGGCNEVFAVPYDGCPACPSSSEPNLEATVCSGETLSLPDAAIREAVFDPSSVAAGAPEPVITWFVDISLTVPFIGAALQHSNADPCLTETVVLYAAIVCTLDNSILSAGSLTIEVYPQPQAPTITQTDGLCNYQLNLFCPTLDSVLGSDFANVAAPGTPGGIAILTLGNNGNCLVDFHVPYSACEEPTSLEQSARGHIEKQEQLRLSLFPNPANQFLCLEGLGEVANYEILDIQGRTHLRGRLQASSSALHIGDLQSGHYFLRLATDGKQQSLRFLIP